MVPLCCAHCEKKVKDELMDVDGESFSTLPYFLKFLAFILFVSTGVLNSEMGVF
jgi:copper chaperone CopZ